MRKLTNITRNRRKKSAQSGVPSPYPLSASERISKSEPAIPEQFIKILYKNVHINLQDFGIFSTDFSSLTLKQFKLAL